MAIVAGVVLMLGVVAGVAMVIIPMRYVLVLPGSASPVSDVVKLSGGGQPYSGRLLLTSVAVLPADPVSALDAKLFNPYSELLPRRGLMPPGQSGQELTDLQRQLLQESAELALAAGLRLAGRPVEASGDGAQVHGVVARGPAEGKLEEGDLIVAINGSPVRFATDLATHASHLQPGDPVTLDVRRNGAPIAVDTVTEYMPASADTLGVLATTHNPRLLLPEDARIALVDAQGLGGPSAGLMIALDAYQRYKPVDLLDGRSIAGTGTIEPSGQVGPVGGVKEKVRAAQQSGATIFLVPAEEADQAKKVAPPGLRVLPVATLQEAIDALTSS